MNLPADSGIRVALAEDHAMVRAGVRLLLEALDDVEVVAEAGDGAVLLQQLAAVEVDVALVDLSMPGMDGLTTIRRIRTEFPLVRVLVLSMHLSSDQVRCAVNAGASGYVTKDAADFELRHALRTVVTAGAYFSPVIARKLLERAPPEVQEELTDRQVEVLTLLAQGKCAKEIAFELGLSPRTVDSHRARIMDRLKIRNMASLTRYAVRKGLLKP
jgi:DNA-binding NarL/FixJ family response regulator